MNRGYHGGTTRVPPLAVFCKTAKFNKRGAIAHTLIINLSNQTICHMDATCPGHVPAYWYWWDINSAYHGGTTRVPPLTVFFFQMIKYSKSVTKVHTRISNWSNQTVWHGEDTRPVYMPAYGYCWLWKGGTMGIPLGYSLWPCNSGAIVETVIDGW